VFEVQGGFKWPLFPLTPSILRDADLMLPDENQAQFKKYNPAIHTWSKVPIGHIITLTPGEHIYLKGYDVSNCQEFDRLLSASQHAGEPHFSKNLPYERTYVRQTLKAKAKTTQKAGNTPSYVLSSESEDGGEGDEDWSNARSKITQRPPTMPRQPVASSSRSVNVKMEPNDTTLVASSSRSVVVKVEPTVIDLTMSDEEDDTIHIPTVHKRARSNSFSSHSSSASVSPSPSTPCLSINETEDNSDDPLPAWPTEFYVIDIVRGFEKCEEARRGRRSVAQAFFTHFKVPFRSTTFYNHRRHWEKASAALRDDALRARRTPAGLWTKFLDRSRATHAGSTGPKAVDKREKKKKRAA
jgi:hypothetical protein